MSLSTIFYSIAKYIYKIRNLKNDNIGSLKTLFKDYYNEDKFNSIKKPYLLKN